jgi:hypothetical protein
VALRRLPMFLTAAALSAWKKPSDTGKVGTKTSCGPSGTQPHASPAAKKVTSAGA